jgi:WD40 repeat protein
MMSISTKRDNYSVSHIYVRASNADELALVRMFTVTCSSDLFIKIWDSENEWKNTKTLVGHEHSVSSVRFTSTLEPLRSLLCARISKGTVTPMYINHGTIAFPVIDVSLSAESRSSADRRPSLPFFYWVYLWEIGDLDCVTKQVTRGRHWVDTVQINAKAIDGNLKSVKP